MTLLFLTHSALTFISSNVSKGCEWLGVTVLEVPDGNSIVSTSGKPLVLRVEFEVIDLGFGIEFKLSFSEVFNIPDFDSGVFTTGSDVFADWGNS